MGGKTKGWGDALGLSYTCKHRDERDMHKTMVSHRIVVGHLAFPGPAHHLVLVPVLSFASCSLSSSNLTNIDIKSRMQSSALRFLSLLCGMIINRSCPYRVQLCFFMQLIPRSRLVAALQ